MTDVTREMVETLSKTNDETIQALLRDGVSVSSESLMSTRVGIMCEVLFGDMDQPTRLDFEYRLQETYRAQLDQVRSQVLRAKLTQGVNGFDHKRK
jgi:hypothetical protein